MHSSEMILGKHAISCIYIPSKVFFSHSGRLYDRKLQGKYEKVSTQTLMCRCKMVIFSFETLLCDLSGAHICFVLF